MSKTLTKASAIALSLTTAVWLSGAAMILPASAATTAELEAQIAALLAQIQALQAQLGAASSGTGGVAVSCSFTQNLYPGDSNSQVKCLQQYMNAAGYTVAQSGAGSAGNETEYFGSLTQAAVKKWQDANGIAYGAWGGYFGPSSRAKYNALASAGTGTGTGTPAVGAALSVMVASDSPTAKTLGSGTAFNPGLKVVFTAGASDVSITGITIQKSGFVANTNLNGIDIVDSSGVRHGQVVTSINADNTITILMSSDPIVVKAGKSETATVRFNLCAYAGCTGSTTYTGTISFSIASASAITADATFSGSFPLTGATMNVVDGSASLATVTMEILASTGSSTLNVDPDSLQEITKFRLAETSSQEGVYLHGWKFYNYGNAAASDYKDVTLEAQDGTVVATAQPSGQYVTFTPSTPYFIDKGLTKTFTIKAKIVDGTTKTIKLVTYNDYDLDVRGATTGVSVIPTGAGADTSFPIGNAYNQTTIGSGSITLQRASDSPSSAVTPGSTNVVLAKFIAKPTGENYELRQVKFYVATTSSGVALTGTLYVKVNGTIVFSAAASTYQDAASADTVNLSSYPILTSNQDNIITIEGSISSSATASDTYTVTSFDLTSVKRLTSNDLLSDDDTGLAVAAVDGLAIPVQAAKLAVTTLATPVANSVVIGTSQYEFATIQLNAQSGGESVRVTSVKVTCTKSTNAAYADVSNLAMYKDSETSPLATTASTATNAATITFSFSTPLTVPKDTPVTLHLKGNVVANSGNSTGTMRYHVASSSGNVAATGVSTGNSLTHGSDITFGGSGQDMTIVGVGNLVLSLVSGSGASPSADQIVTVGTTNASVFAFKLTSQYETQKITSLIIRATSSVSDTLSTTTLTNIKLYEGGASTPFATAPQFDACVHSDVTATSTNCYVTFTASDNLLSAPVPTGGVTIYVKADISAGGTARLGDYFKFLIASTTTDVAVKGSITGLTSGTKTGTPAVTGMSYVVPQSVVIEGIEPTTATNVGLSAGQKVGVFKITNNGTAPIYLATTTITFANGGSASSTAVDFKLYSSAAGGGQSDTSAWNCTSTGATGASSSVAFNLNAVTTPTTNLKIDGGSWRYLTIKTSSSTAANNDTFQFSISALGNVLYTVAETDLGYDGNANNSLSDSIYDLYVDGIPSLSTVTAKT